MRPDLSPSTRFLPPQRRARVMVSQLAFRRPTQGPVDRRGWQTLLPVGFRGVAFTPRAAESAPDISSERYPSGQSGQPLA